MAARGWGSDRNACLARRRAVHCPGRGGRLSWHLRGPGPAPVPPRRAGHTDGPYPDDYDPGGPRRSADRPPNELLSHYERRTPARQTRWPDAADSPGPPPHTIHALIESDWAWPTSTAVSGLSAMSPSQAATITATSRTSASRRGSP